VTPEKSQKQVSRRFSLWEYGSKQINWDPVNNYPKGEYTMCTHFEVLDDKVNSAVPFFLRLASVGSKFNPLLTQKAGANALFPIPVDQLELIEDVNSIHVEMYDLQKKRTGKSIGSKSSGSKSSKAESDNKKDIKENDDMEFEDITADGIDEKKKQKKK